MPLTIELPERESLTEFNLRRWEEILADPPFPDHPGRVETDRHGHLIMTPFASSFHGGFQADLITLLAAHLSTGRTSVECPVSTSDGVKIADVVWCSSDRYEHLRHEVCYSIAPEICVEVVSPSNTKRELTEKTALYLEAGAIEVWLCEADGRMIFQKATGVISRSEICPAFPAHIPQP